MQIHFHLAEDHLRWVYTDGLKTLGQQEIAVMLPWLEQDSREALLLNLLRSIENYLLNQPKRILPAQTMHYGWTTLRFVPDEHHLSGIRTEVLLIEEMEHPFSLVFYAFTLLKNANNSSHGYGPGQKLRCTGSIE